MTNYICHLWYHKYAVFWHIWVFFPLSVWIGHLYGCLHKGQSCKVQKPCFRSPNQSEFYIHTVDLVYADTYPDMASCIYCKSFKNSLETGSQLTWHLQGEQFDVLWTSQYKVTFSLFSLFNSYLESENCEHVCANDIFWYSQTNHVNTFQKSL